VTAGLVALLPASHEVAVAVLAGGDLPWAHARDWPHADTADALRPLAEHPSDTGEGTFLITENGVVVGDCGWFGPPADGVVDLGYGLAPSARGRGVATAAVRLLLEWVALRGAVQARADVLPGNVPSLRLLARLGFVEVGELAGHRVLVREVRHSS
jgi:RimJ/RimL family protein N-acetyltransferase